MGCVQVPCVGLEVVSSTESFIANIVFCCCCEQSVVCQRPSELTESCTATAASSPTTLAAPLFSAVAPLHCLSSALEMNDVSFPSDSIRRIFFVANFSLIPILNVSAESPAAVRCQHQFVVSACGKKSATSPRRVTDEETVKSTF